MPTSIGVISWTQCCEFVKFRIMLHPLVPLKSLDISTHADYMKLNSPPFYQEIFLHNSIDVGLSKCTIIGRCVSFVLKKAENGLWEELEMKLADKSMKMDRKQLIIHENQKRFSDELEEKLQRKVECKREDMLKEIDRLAELKKSREKKFESAIPKNAIQCISVTSKKPLPIQPAAIRRPSSIIVTFSDRAFPTPKRESQVQLEEDWLSAQMQVKRSIGFVDDDLREEERNPAWLLAKGNEFYGNGNYLAAISAYTTGIKFVELTNPLAMRLHLNRAGAQLCEENFRRCVEDCTKALDILKQLPPDQQTTPEWKKRRIQCLARRGAALCKMGLLKDGYGELLAAWNLDSRNSQLKEDLVAVRQQIDEINVD